MKGIRKLFLGLVLMTLIGVGFKTEVKAADAPSLSLTFQKENNGSIKETWDDADTTLWCRIALKTSYFTDSDGTVEYTFLVSPFTTTWKTPGGKLTLTKAGDTYIINGDTTNPYTAATLPNNQPIFTISKSVFTGYFNTNGSGTQAVNVDITSDKHTGTQTVNSYSVTGFKISPIAKYDDTEGKPDDVTFVTPEKNVLLVPESGKFKVDNNAGSGFLIDKWQLGTGRSIENVSEGGKPACTLTVTDSDLPINPVNKLFAIYKDNPDVGLKITDLNGKDISGAVFAANGTIDQKNYIFTGGYKGSDIATTHPITIDGKDVSELNKTAGTSGSLQFKTPSGLNGGPYNMVVNMKDGKKFTFPVYVVDADSVTLSLEPAGDKSIGVGESVTFTPKLSSSVPITKITYDFTSEKDRVTVTEADNKLTLTGVSKTTSGVKFTATAKYKIEGASEKSKSAGPVTVTVTNPVLNLSDVYVNEGLTIPLSHATHNDYVSISSITLNNSAGSYISVSKSSTPALAKNITITGNNATKTITNGITVDTKSAGVTVFPKPTLSMDKSGSGSSMKYTFKVTMPDKAYHGSTWGKDITKAKIQFVGKDGTYTMDAFDLTADTTGYTKKNKNDVTIDIKKLREVFNDICKEDKEEVEVTVYADGDKDIISEKKNLKVYKIRLDGSAGADYKIMGESVSDKFYAIDGVSYEISSTPKSGYTGTPTKWDGVSFGTNSSGTSSFSESKTIKAYYTGGSSSQKSNAGGAGGAGGASLDDYDDVPKTGESKTDIWILWTVLFISILGAGFMIWKRFGLVRAIAEADQEVMMAEREEKAEAEAKAKEDKLNMLKDLRNL